MKKNMNQIRDVLCDQIDDLRKKKTTPAVANAVCNTTGKLFTSIKLEVEAMKVAGQQVGSRFLELTVGGSSQRRRAKN